MKETEKENNKIEATIQKQSPNAIFRTNNNSWERKSRIRN